ncbi:MAG TPA: 16S rRNA (guanine(527)-N(7))-methyltransferase RsmG [Bacteroidia bacterium]|nr:16S rRNA (guanine(527)-N(7))-methyltransferase RsmG [Bacteroidota bacterium]HRC33162.1 16S rRNA (guanine(527)-N(7))-methyltransferase RsmG [Bacteroidia bacterium]
MDSSAVIKKYFPQTSDKQIELFEKFAEELIEWNQKINLISRKDVDNIFVNHILHSLTIAKYFSFADNTQILDIGTGGGFPGIPLAIIFPNCHFTLVDSIAKKIVVVNDLIEKLQLKNVSAINERAEKLNIKVDVVVTRATASIDDLMKWCSPLFMRKGTMPFRGLLALKGGDIEEECQNYTKYITINDLKKNFTEEFFETKKLVFLHVP